MKTSDSAARTVPVAVDPEPTQFRSDTADTRYTEGAIARYAYRRLGPRGGVPLVMCMRFRGTIDHWDPALLEYFKADFNAKLAATRLHVHPNTARYRLAKVEDRTGCDLRRVSDVIGLVIACRIARPSTTPQS